MPGRGLRASLTTTRSSSRPVAVAITGGIGAGKTDGAARVRAHGAAVDLERRDRPRAPARRSRGEAGGRRPLRRRTSSAPTARSTGGRSGEIVFADRRGARLARAAPPPARRRAATSRWREELAELPDAAGGLRHRGPAPLRGRRRVALRQGGRRHRLAGGAHLAPHRAAARPRAAAAPGGGEDRAGRLRLRQRRDARRARRVRVRRGGHPVRRR